MSRYPVIIAIIILIFLASSIFIDLYYYNKIKQPSQDGAWQIAYSDFKVFWNAGKEFYLRYLNDPAYGPIDIRYGPIYDFKKDLYHFRYSPFAAFAFSFLARLPLGLAHIAWSILNNIFFLLSLIWLDRIFTKGALIPASLKAMVSAAIAVLVLRFYLNNIALGQADCFIALLWVSFLSFYICGNTILCAMVLALALQFKPFFLSVIPYFILTRKWKLSFYRGIAFAVFLAIPMVKIGYAQEWRLLIQEWIKIMTFSVKSQITNPKNQSFVCMLSKLAGFGGGMKSIYIFSSAIYIALLAGLLSLRHRSKKDPLFQAFEISYLTLIVLLSSPLIWKASFIYVIAPVAFILYRYAAGAGNNISYLSLAAFFALTTVFNPDIMKNIGYPALHSIQPIPVGACFLLLSLVLVYKVKKNEDRQFDHIAPP